MSFNKRILFVFNWVLVAILFVSGCSTKKENSHFLTIGCITILSGDVATYGKETKQGIDLAVEEANESGILGTRKIRVVYEDDKIDAKTGTQAIQKLISVDKTPIIIGAFSSRVTLAIAPIAERNKTVLLSASATADAIKDAGDFIFRIVPPNKAQGTTAAQFALDTLNKKTSAIFYVNDEYGVSLAAEFKKAYEDRGGKVVFYEAFSPGQRDFRTTIEKMKQLNPEMVYFPGQAGETGLILKQSKELGLEVPFIGGDGSYSPDLIKIAGNAADGSFYTLMAMGYGVSDSLIETFTNKFVSKYGEKPTVYAAYAYEAGKIVSKILSESDYSGESIRDHLYALKDYRGITGYTSFDKFGEVNKTFYVYTIKNGQFTLAGD
jgi:branched-chain amino acid transport system substrate-binding protein